MFRAVRGPAASLLMICVAAAALAVLAPGRAIEVPRASGAFGFGACPPPCWAGIIVGQTPFNDVGIRFERNIVAREKQIDFANNGAVYWGIAEASMVRNQPTTAFSGNLLAQAGAAEVTYIHLNVELPLWYLLLTLGDPVEVQVHQPFPDVQRVEMVVRWELPNVRAAARLRVLSPADWGLYTAVSSLTLAVPGDGEALGLALRAHHIIGQTDWRGFVPFGDYVHEAEQRVQVGL